MTATGSKIAGYRVERVRHAIAGRVLADARGPDGRPVLLRIATGADPAQVERIERLSDAIGPPLLPVLDAGHDGEVAYVAHPAHDGTTLAEALADGPLDRLEAVRLLSQVAGGLESMTALGLAHGELVPATVLVSARHPRQAVLCDYGFGPPAVPVGADPAAVEAIAYQAPELARGKPVDPQTSVYAFGCLLAECLTGAPPYPAVRPLLTVHAHRVAAPPLLSERRDDLPAALDAVVARALTKAPEQRPKSPGKLMEAVQRALKQRSPIRVLARPRPQTPRRSAVPTAARPVAPRRASHPPPRRRRRLRISPVAIALSMALLAATAGFAAGERRPASPAPSAPRVVDSGRAAYTRAVDGAVQELSAKRSEGVAAMQAARTSGAQRTAALGLARTYATARVAIAQAPHAPANSPLAPHLRDAEVAYRRLARAARAHDAGAYRAARVAATRAERAFAHELAPLSR